MSAIGLHAKASADFAAKLAATQDLLTQANNDYSNPDGESFVVQASSLGAEDMVISHLINTLGLKIGIFVLDTGQLHPETLTLLEAFKKSSQAPLSVYQPVQEQAMIFVQKNGPDAMYQSIGLRKACCQIRKIEPLERALSGKKAWITGLRREQSATRAEVPMQDHSDQARLKFNPLSAWTWGDVWHYIKIHQLAYNPLHDAFYPSIGCAPCTRAISLGEDFRSGRWWWENETAKECGLHVSAPEKAAV